MKRTHDDMGLAYEAALLAQQLQAPKGGRQQQNSASAAKIKVCSQCGTTRTPQWREGPLGPKTLCNACGVKRVRALKAIQEGRKPPASPQIKKAAAAAAAAQAAAIQQQQSLHLDPPPRQESVDVAMTLQLLASKADAAGHGRATRPAAPRSGRRVFELTEDARQGKGSAAPAESNPTDSGEEISWSPRHVDGTGLAGGSGEEEDTEVAAAANLLSMSMQHSQQRLQQQAGAGPRLQQQQRQVTQAQLQQEQALRQLHTAFQQAQQQQAATSHPQHFLAAVKHEDAEACQALLGPAMPALAELLSPQQLLELVRARELVEGAQREAAAADAAVAAVSKILEVKQEAAAHARGAAMAAAKALHALLLRLDAEFSSGVGAGSSGSPARSATPPLQQQHQQQLMQQAQQLQHAQQQLQHAQQLQQQAQQLQAQQQQAAALALAIAALAPAPGLLSA